ncbi:hypothetical protein HH214_18060 [Mucilaginibacter robiniae]|uniref:Peptidase A2 domain-containing protein n=1 Tax=Mucilaginibacter robiniae TaxID=2728022 RepID=A0A7L5EB81_9SPHI|nr:pepsin/retropepsin-like aspartic protease family protein [Mucilaginibacter robiniae]QJD97646.1 hypothetical protein HH214_18060 [Mucilaginibacter robiniae]
MLKGGQLALCIITLLLSLTAAAKPCLIIKNGSVQTFTDSVETDDFKTFTIPIKRAGNLIIVEAQVDSIAGNFVLDTGAPYLVLNATYFRDMPHFGDRESAGVNGNSAGTFRTEVHNFSLGFDLHYNKLMADVADLSAIENSKKIKILGLLGTQVFEKLAITIDLFHNVLYLHKTDASGNILPEERVFAQPQISTPFKYMNDVIFIKGTINEKTLWLAFDTGAESNLLSFDVPGKVMKYMQIINKAKLVGIGGCKYDIFYAQFDHFTIGNYLFTNNRILITDLNQLGKAYGNSVDGILGYDFFSRGIFTLNFVKKEFEMYIYKH